MIKDQEVGNNKRAFKVLPRAYIGYLISYVASNIYKIWVLILHRVIILRNMTFDENVFFDLAEHKKQAGQLVSEAKNVVEAIEEDEIQDVKSILEEIGLFDTDSMETRALKEPSDAPSLLNSGVIEKANLPQAQRNLGLWSPESTPPLVQSSSVSQMPPADLTADELLRASIPLLKESASMPVATMLKNRTYS